MMELDTKLGAAARFVVPSGRRCLFHVIDGVLNIRGLLIAIALFHALVQGGSVSTADDGVPVRDGGSKSELAVDDADRDATEAVFEVLRTLRDRRSNLYNRFAAVGVGEVINMYPGGPSSSYVAFVRAMDRERGWDHTAEYVPNLDRNQGDECIKESKQFRVRWKNEMLGSPYRPWTGGEGDRIPHGYREVGFDPYDDIPGAVSARRQNAEAGEQSKLEEILNRADFVSAKRKAGLINAVWRLRFDAENEQEFGITFDPKVDNLPVKIDFQTTLSSDGTKAAFSSRCRYRVHKGVTIPVWYECQDEMNANTPKIARYCIFKIFWLIGDELPDAYFESEDPLAWLFDRFELPHSRRVGRTLIPVDHALPSDLTTYNGEQFD